MNCSYRKKIVERFQEHFPDLVPILKHAKFLIPLVHVHNHKENCEYLYLSAYSTSAGHFHRETAEHEWAELNQVATQVRQMNNGHRQDTLIDHHGNWNFKKMANMGALLEADIIHSSKVFEKKYETFLGMTQLYSESAIGWNMLDRSLHTVGADKQIECVFRHRTGNGTSYFDYRSVKLIFLQFLHRPNFIRPSSKRINHDQKMLCPSILILKLMFSLSMKESFSNVNSVSSVLENIYISDRHSLGWNYPRNCLLKQTP